MACSGDTCIIYIGLYTVYTYIQYIHIYYQNFLPKGRSFTANIETKVAVLSKGRSSTANSGTKVAILLGINRCGSFPLLSEINISVCVCVCVCVCVRACVRACVKLRLRDNTLPTTRPLVATAEVGLGSSEL